MNSRQLEYAVLLAKIRNYSQVAELLGISQPALSKQILNLEKGLGVKLFDRGRQPLELTPAGEYFIRGAQELLYREERLVHTMEKFKSGETGHLVIGISPYRSLLIADVIRQVKLKYPGVRIVLRELSSTRLREEAADGKYDFAIVNLPVEEPALEVIPMGLDALALAVPKELAKTIVHTQGKEQKEVDLKDCKELPFIVVGKGQEMRRQFDKMCADAEIEPNIAAEVVGLTTAWSLACAGVGAALLPLQCIHRGMPAGTEASTVVFQIKGAMCLRHPAIIIKKGQYISECAAYAIQLLKAKQDTQGENR